MTRTVLALLAGVPLVTSIAFCALLFLVQVREAFDAQLVGLTGFFLGLSAILATALWRWMRDPNFRLAANDEAIEPQRAAITRAVLVQTLLGLGLGIAFAALFKLIGDR